MRAFRSPRATSGPRRAALPPAAARAARASSRRGDADVALGESAAQGPREGRRARLVAVNAKRLGGDSHALAGEARDVALLDHGERLGDRLFGVLDHAAGLVARREGAFLGVAAIGEHFATHRHAGALGDLVVLAA